VDINNYRLRAAPINTAVDAIITQIEGMTDLDGQPLFPNVKRGLELPTGPPPESGTPSVHVWHDKGALENDSVQMLFGHGEHILDLFVTCYSFNGSDLQAQRDSLCLHLLQHLQAPDGAVTSSEGIEPAGDWRFVNPQTVDIDHTSPFKKILEFVPVMPPWYVSRISIAIEVWPIDYD
jgi:hypothetical protein